MAITGTTRWEVTPEGNDLNGGGHARAATTLAASSFLRAATTSSPIFSSTAYSFVSADISGYLFLSGNANSLMGYYPIVNVTAGSAILAAAPGDREGGMMYSFHTVIPNRPTTTGAATTTTASTFTWSVDYCRTPTARYIATDLESHSVSGFLIKSSASGFGWNCVGNIVHIVSGTGWTAGRYSAVAFRPASGYLELDRTAGAGAVSGTCYLGGSLASPGVATGYGTSRNGIFIKSGTYTISSTASAVSNSILMILSNINTSFTVGYYQKRFDKPTKEQLPLLQVTSPVASATICGSSPSGRNDTIWMYLAVDGGGQPGITAFRHSTLANGFIHTIRCWAKDCDTGTRVTTSVGSFVERCRLGNNSGANYFCITVAATSLFEGNNYAFMSISAQSSGATNLGAFSDYTFFCTAVALTGLYAFGVNVLGSLVQHGNVGTGNSAFSPGMSIETYHANLQGLALNLRGGVYPYHYVEDNLVSQPSTLALVNSRAEYMNDNYTISFPSTARNSIRDYVRSFAYWGYSAFETELDMGAVQSPEPANKTRSIRKGGKL